jgi:hypothetical protein
METTRLTFAQTGGAAVTAPPLLGTGGRSPDTLPSRDAVLQRGSGLTERASGADPVGTALVRPHRGSAQSWQRLKPNCAPVGVSLKWSTVWKLIRVPSS